MEYRASNRSKDIRPSPTAGTHAAQHRAPRLESCATAPCWGACRGSDSRCSASRRSASCAGIGSFMRLPNADATPDDRALFPVRSGPVGTFQETQRRQAWHARCSDELPWKVRLTLFPCLKPRCSRINGYSSRPLVGLRRPSIASLRLCPGTYRCTERSRMVGRRAYR